jgi:hypothetical protein
MNCIHYGWKMECHGWISFMSDYVNNDDVGNDVDNDPHTLSHELS